MGGYNIMGHRQHGQRQLHARADGVLDCKARLLRIRTILAKLPNNDGILRKLYALREREREGEACRDTQSERGREVRLRSVDILHVITCSNGKGS